MRQFVAYLIDGHNAAELGRWDRMEPRYAKPLAPATAKMYFTHLATFYRWLVIEEYLEESPMEKIATPQARPDQLEPYKDDQVEALLTAAKATKYPQRDYALILLLFDTGMRTSELCGLRSQDLDLVGGSTYVLGKGNKKRQVCLAAKPGRLCGLT